ncbi:MAG: 3-phosphoglycerate dehydrogenase [Bacteroidales bacterium]|mgnify:CR=1 FL=1|nr:3-phosphoglycerate dehydrogenase [Bacteroidales bacterium]
MKVLVATEKPFAKAAVDGIREIVEKNGHTLALLENYTDVNDLYKAVADADALIVRSDKVTKEVVDAAKNLKIVVRAGAGYDNLDLEACTAKGIVAMNTPGQNSNAVAELIMGMMIYMARNQFTPASGTELAGKKLGIHAFGNIGRLVAKYGQGLGMDVYVYRPTGGTVDAPGVTQVATVEELYSTCNYVSLHIPANDKTKKSIGYDLLSKMPKGGTLINAARKEVIDEEGLAKAFAERTDLKYATDVAATTHADLVKQFEGRVYATPKKMGAQTSEANINAGLASANQIVNFFATGDKTYQVN